MPHLVILYTPNLERETDMGGLCRSLANELGQFGIRVNSIHPNGVASHIRH